MGTYRFFNLPLVDLQFVLQLLHQLLHALVGLVVLLGLEDELFEAALILPQRLDCLHMLFLLTVQLCLKFLDLGEKRNMAEGMQVFGLGSSVALGGGVIAAMSTSSSEKSRQALARRVRWLLPFTHLLWLSDGSLSLSLKFPPLGSRGGEAGQGDRPPGPSSSDTPRVKTKACFKKVIRGEQCWK